MIKITFKDKLLVYICKKSDRLDDEKEQLILFNRYRKLDANDHLEQIIADVRAEAFREFQNDILAIMKITK